MPENKNANQEQGPTNEERSEEEPEEETKTQETKEHYEHMVDDAILGGMKNDEESS